MQDGGYDEGYKSCSCFWGMTPAGYVSEAVRLSGPGNGRFALDFGCGEGKNAAVIAAAGFQVTAIDKSAAAISNAQKLFGSTVVRWWIGDLMNFEGEPATYDLVIATGSLHCLASAEDVSAAVNKMQSLTKVGGYNVLYAFDNGPHDMRGHGSDFRPILLPHSLYVGAYEDWEIVRSSSEVQPDVHPHNHIEHFHSITRLLARRKI